MAIKVIAQRREDKLGKNPGKKFVMRPDLYLCFCGGWLMSDIDDDSLIALQVEGALVADFADEMELLASGIGRDMDIDDATLHIIDSELRSAYLGLLPPQEQDGVAVRVVGL